LSCLIYISSFGDIFSDFLYLTKKTAGKKDANEKFLHSMFSAGKSHTGTV